MIFKKVDSIRVKQKTLLQTQHFHSHGPFEETPNQIVVDKCISRQ